MKNLIPLLFLGILGLAGTSSLERGDKVRGNLYLVSETGTSLEPVSIEIEAPRGAQALAQAWARAVLEPPQGLSAPQGRLSAPRGQSAPWALESPFPKGTSLKHLYLLRDGTAVLDLSKEALEVPSGATSELLTVYSLVATLCENVKEVSRIFIMIEGERMMTLAGHLGLEKPLEPNIQLVGLDEIPEVSPTDG